MFTGLIQQLGTVVDVRRTASSCSIEISLNSFERPFELGESIAIDGVCLTCTQVSETVVSFDVLKETLERTNLGDRQQAHRVNIERALRVGDPLGGHLVQGHVDDTGRIDSIKPAGKDHLIQIACSSELTQNMVYKGSIAVNGVSLTITALAETGFSVHIIPHTWFETSLSGLAPGSRVNIETDVYAKHLRKLLATGSIPRQQSWDEIRGIIVEA